MKVHRWWKDIHKAAVEQGWEVELTRGGHMRWRSPSGAVVFCGSSPSKYSAVGNTRAALRRAGLKL